MITVYFFRAWSNRANMLVLGIFLGSLVVACAPPIKPAALQSAEAAVEEVQSDPGVERYAPVKLDKAQKALQRAQAAWKEGKVSEEVAHRAYLAKQRAIIAEVAATGGESQAQVQKLNEEREQILREVNEFETRQAREQAKMAGARAQRASEQAKAAEARIQQAKEQAETAEARAAQLEQRLSEIKAKETKRGYVVTLGDILFEIDKADLTAGGMQNLLRLAAFLKEFPDREVAIEGHTDSTGSEAYNLDLSQRRAESVRRFLIKNGIAPDRIMARGYGEVYPVAPNDTAAGRQHNRRVEIVILRAGEQAEEYRRSG